MPTQPAIRPTAGNRTISWTLVDGDGTDGGAGNDTLAFNTTVSVVAVNDSPVVAVAAAAASTEQVAGTIDAAATITDAELGGRNDYAGSALNVARSGGAVAQDLLTFGPSGAFTVNGGNLEAGGLVFATFTGGNGTALVINFTSSGTPATQALVRRGRAIAAIYLSPATPRRRRSQMVYSFNDGAPTNAGQGGVGSPTGTDTITINITDTPENAAPVVDLNGADGAGNDFASNYTEGGTDALVADTDVTITDADAGDQVQGATITIADAIVGDQLHHRRPPPRQHHRDGRRNRHDHAERRRHPGAVSAGADPDPLLERQRQSDRLRQPTTAAASRSRSPTASTAASRGRRSSPSPASTTRRSTLSARTPSPARIRSVVLSGVSISDVDADPATSPISVTLWSTMAHC